MSCCKAICHRGQECISAARRYLEVRREMMKSPEGRKALLEGVPDVVIEVAELEHILQARWHSKACEHAVMTSWNALNVHCMAAM